MSQFHLWLRRTFERALATRCRRGGCELLLDGLGRDVVVLDVDEYIKCRPHGGHVSDFLVFPVGSRVAAVVVEVKDGRLDAGRAIEQLQGGANACERIAVEARAAVEAIYPVAVYQRPGHANELKVFERRRKIRFCERTYEATLVKCGQAVSAALPRRAAKRSRLRPAARGE